VLVEALPVGGAAVEVVELALVDVPLVPEGALEVVEPVPADVLLGSGVVLFELVDPLGAGSLGGAG
jgi:hypothetical protein